MQSAVPSPEIIRMYIYIITKSKPLIIYAVKCNMMATFDSLIAQVVWADNDIARSFNNWIGLACHV